MFGLPKEIETTILQYDPTKRELFDKAIHNLKFILVLQQLEVRSAVFEYWYGEEWFYFYFSFYKSRERGFREPLEEVKKDAWRRFLRMKLRSVV